jgi:hypothetical protein
MKEKKKVTKAAKKVVKKEVDNYSDFRDAIETVISKYSKKMEIEELQSALLSTLCLNICMTSELTTEDFLEIAGEHFVSEREFVDEIEMEIMAEEDLAEIQEEEIAPILKANESIN